MIKIIGIIDRWRGRRYARRLGYHLPADELFARLYNPRAARGYRCRR